MASIQKRKNKNGTSHWRAVVRIKGYPTVCNHFERKQEAEDWAADIERQIKLGKFKFVQHKQQHTFAQLIDRYVSDGALQHIRSAEDVMHHLNYWKARLGDDALVHLTPDLIGQERQYLVDTPTSKNLERSPAKVNRYVSSLSALLSYAVRLRWIDENPCFNLTKLKENSGRDRVLSEDEISRLLTSCLQSKSPYLYCIVLMSLTTGARLRYWKLGYCPETFWRDRSSWGLSEKPNARGLIAKLWLPQGIVIPTLLDGNVTKIKIRRPDPHKQQEKKFQKYVVVSGSMEFPTVYGDLSKPILIMESELDAMLTFKAINEICCVIALGGAQKKPDLELHQHLKQSPRILLALDFDEGGMKGNLFWRSIYPQLLFWPVPEGKGPGDAIKLGLDLRRWIEAGLKAIKL
ncbi:MAG: hypothetical protein LLG04_12800 [Parachlamydia sp.]|nr:hypothetical protein [Parachlamydia sp.]